MALALVSSYACPYNEQVIRSQRTYLLIATALIGGCSSVENGRSALRRNDTPLDAVIAFHARAQTLKGADWAREYSRLAALTGDESRCLRQAILAAAPAAPDYAHPAALFEQCERELRKRDSPLLGLATLLRSEYAERVRCEEKAREANRRADEATQKLNDLRAIERNLRERGQGTGRGP